MRSLYHFPLSPFSRRARLALAHKGLEVTLRDAREDPAVFEEGRALTPLKTVPVLLEDEPPAVVGQGPLAIGDSTAISHYLDRAYPDLPRLWPARAADAEAAFTTAALCDVALDGVVNTGNRFFALSDSPAWPTVRGEMASRIQRALDGLAARIDGRLHVAGNTWSAPDIWLYCATRWLELLPARAQTVPLAAQLVSIGWKLPPELVAWANRHAGREDIVALG